MLARENRIAVPLVPLLLMLAVLSILASSSLGVRIYQVSGFAPREPTIAEGLYIVSLDDAMNRQLNFTFKTPSGIPHEYGLQGVILFDMDPLAPAQDKQAFSPIRVGLLYSTHPLETNLTLSQFITKYSTILVAEGYGSGGNATNPYAGNGGNATYLWGYPSLIHPNYVRVFKFDEHTYYQVTAENLTPEQRLTIAETLITRPSQTQTETVASTRSTTTTINNTISIQNPLYNSSQRDIQFWNQSSTATVCGFANTLVPFTASPISMPARFNMSTAPTEGCYKVSTYYLGALLRANTQYLINITSTAPISFTVVQGSGNDPSKLLFEASDARVVLNKSQVILSNRNITVDQDGLYIFIFDVDNPLPIATVDFSVRPANPIAVTTTTTTTSITVTTSVTTATTLTNTITATSTEQVTDPSTNAWAVSATVAAVVLAFVLLLQRRRK
jgi:hypothetical protein